MSHRILLVEDDTDSGEALRLLLQSQGYDVVWAASGKEAVWAARSDPGHPVDLILLDLMLPDMDGVAVIERLSESGPVPPVVIHSASTVAVAEEARRRIGAAAVLRKPTEWSRMKEVIERACAVGSGQRG